MIKTKDLLIQAIIFLGIALLSSPALLYRFGIYDEGIPIVAAMRINAGEIPYLDFWMQYAPGIPYLIALCSFITNNVIVASRIIDLISRTLLVWILFKNSKTNSGTVSILSLSACIVGIGFISTMEISGYNALPGLAISLLILQRWQDAERGFLTGVLCATLALVRDDFVVYVTLALFGTTVIEYLSRPRGRAVERKPTPLSFSVGLGITVLPIILILLSSPTLRSEAYQQLVLFPLYEFPKYRSLPYPSLSMVMAAESLTRALSLSRYIALPAFFLLSLAWEIRGGVANQKSVISFLLFGLFTINYVKIRPDDSHIFVPLFTAIFSSWLILARTLEAARPRRAEIVRYAIVILAIIVTCTTVRSTVFTALVVTQTCHAENKSYILCILKKQESRLQAATFVQSVTSPHERIFLLSDKNNLIDTNDVAFYALAERLPATRFQELHPGVVTPLNAQVEIIKELESEKVRILVQEHTSQNRELRKTSKYTASPLDSYVLKEFKEIASFEAFKIFQRKPPL